MNFESLEQQLQSDNPLERDNAVQDMASLGDFRAIKVLAESLADETDIQVIEAMLEALRVLLEYAPRVLIPLLSNDNPSIRNGVIRVLHDSGDSVIKILDELARNDDKDIRKFAIDALKTKKSPSALAVIRSRLDDGDDNVKMTAVEYLGNLEDRESAPKIHSILTKTDKRMTQFVCLEALLKLDDETTAKATLNYLLSFENVPILLQSSFFKLLAIAGTPDHFVGLDNALAENSATVGNDFVKAVIAISKRHSFKEIPKKIFQSIENAKDSLDLYVRNEFDSMFTNRGDTGRKEHVWSNIESEDPSLIVSGLQILAATGDQKDIDRLQDLADKTDDDDFLDMISETIVSMMSRIEQGETS